MAAGRVLGGSGGLGLLLSGLPAFIIAFTILYSVAWAIAQAFYSAVEHVLEHVIRSFRRSYQLMKKTPETPEAKSIALSTPKAIAVSFTTLTFCIVVTSLQIIRPKSQPYAHMSGSLPLTLIEAAFFQSVSSEFCLAHPVEPVIFPWEQFANFYGQSHTSDWLPRSLKCSKTPGLALSLWPEHPDGDDLHGSAPPEPPHGYSPPLPPKEEHSPPKSDDFSTQGKFRELYSGMDDTHNDFRHKGPSSNHRHGHHGGYDPLCDPMKLSNINSDVMRSLANSLNLKKPKIKNVLLLTLESTRKDMFPLKKDSHVYKTILSSYASSNASEKLDEKLQNLTNTATFLSGESNGFGTKEDSLTIGSWKQQFKDGMGVINIQGAITQAAYTLKSLLSSHCGVEPLPVDFTEETKSTIYQSCLPHIFDTMNFHLRKEFTREPKRSDNSQTEDYQTWLWESAMIQSVTDQFDSQDLLDAQMGFENVIAEGTISDQNSKHYPPKEPWVNYFGFPETESLDYLRDLFVNARQDKKRLFVSHLTSSTHHPFATPKSWAGRAEYLNKQRWQPEDPLDGYLNTIKYQDDWISEIFQMLHEVRALNETLIIMTGDHGLAFKSLDKSQSAVDNGHISNFAIPLLMVHPDLPRLQLNASTTPLSIIPTVLDLLLQTDSLPESAISMVENLIPRYQGNSLIRDLNYSVMTSDGGFEGAFFQPFHFSSVNPGGALLAISDASTTFRLTFPLCSSIPLRFTDIATDPTEAEPSIAWTMDELISIVKVKHGLRAKEWVKLAQELGRWWFWDQHSKWGYWGNARGTGRGGAEVAGAGRVKMKHWWET